VIDGVKFQDKKGSCPSKIVEKSVLWDLKNRIRGLKGVGVAIGNTEAILP
jgi:hypothetical protein